MKAEENETVKAEIEKSKRAISRQTTRIRRLESPSVGDVYENSFGSRVVFASSEKVIQIANDGLQIISVTRKKWKSILANKHFEKIGNIFDQPTLWSK